MLTRTTLTMLGLLSLGFLLSCSPALPEIIIVTPVDGEAIEYRSVYIVEWEYTGDLQKVVIMLTTPEGGIVRILDYAEAEACGYEWKVLSDPGQYRIMVGMGKTFDLSGVFSVVTSASVPKG